MEETSAPQISDLPLVGESHMLLQVGPMPWKPEIGLELGVA